jgi:NAD-dependent DNA ligase
MVHGAGDPARARELVAIHPASQPRVAELHLEDLARRGRIAQLTAAAHAADRVERAALLLAIWGRPLAALELAALARHHTPELVCARALACYRAGRPDLTDRILAEDLPPSALVDDEALRPFPGPDEHWRIAEAAAAHPALAALAAGRDAIIALAQPAPHDAEPDAATIAPVAAVAQRLDRSVAGATVHLAGELKRLHRDKVVAAIEANGARLVAGPIPGTDFYVLGDGCPVQTIAELERHGARRLRTVEEFSRPRPARRIDPDARPHVRQDT